MTESSVGRNGSHRIVWWLLGTATTVILAGGAAWAANVNARLTQIENMQAARNERLATLETRVIGVEATLARVEAKLDLAINRP